MANLVLIGICATIAIFCRKRLAEDLQNIWYQMKQEKEASGKKFFGKFFLLLLLIILYVYGTSRGIIHYDTSLYHAQSIRWIEEYGVVKGLGNLHCRLAYNSASFALSALYSMAFLGGQSYHVTAGFLALLLAFICLKLTDIFKRKSLKPSDFARVMCIYYLLIIFDEMVSPASDYFMVLTAFYIVIRWMDLLEEKENAIFPYAMLCVLGVYLMTIKLSAALIVFLVIKPAWMLIREKKWKEIGIYLTLGILIAAPFLIRNVILSGWLVYPFTSIDLFSVDWKIPEGVAAYDAKEIQVWGRGYSDVTRFDIAIMEWLPDWFRGLGGMDKLFVLGALISVAIFGLRLIWSLIREKAVSDKLLLEAVISLCFLFWLLSSPLIRYGCVYVYLVSAVVLGDVCTELFHNEKISLGKQFFHGKNGKKLEKICIALIGVFLLYKAATFGKELVNSYVNDYWICQKDYENYETESYEIEGITFYCPVSGDQVGYESFPSSPAKAQIAFRGAGIKDGFYHLNGL
ncbi:MAG: hypothetical protein J6B68_11865 [Lachnospiraceae bacterium]|nr:hypothetical protein [Lachnospiraceae bacterium]